MLKISLIGAGNVAYHLGHALHDKGHYIHQVFNRTLARATALATELKASSVDKIQALDPEVDLIIISISDDAIQDMARQIARLGWEKQPIIAHTSGATPITAMEALDRPGIFYPLQSFSREKIVDFQEVPFCLFAKTEKDIEILKVLAGDLSDKLYLLNDEQRSALHVAAVFANNFTNYLFSISAEILGQSDIPFDLIRPLIIETARKVQQNEPNKMQTGPAIRGDQVTIERHLNWITENAVELKEIYELLTAGIQKS